MRQLELHALLDVVEVLLEENLDAKQLTALRRELYKPEPGQQRVSGFTPREEMAGFRALQAQFAGRRG